MKHQIKTRFCYTSYSSVNIGGDAVAVAEYVYTYRDMWDERWDEQKKSDENIGKKS